MKVKISKFGFFYIYNLIFATSYCGLLAQAVRATTVTAVGTNRGVGSGHPPVKKVSLT
jgi:hypothetical protein